MPTPNKPIVDVIICSKNNEEIIERCIKSVMDQTYKKINCIVADDNSTDKTRKIIRKKFPKVKILHLTSGKGPAYNRNIAITKSDGKYIVTMDSDATLAPNWIEELVPKMELDTQVGVGSGKILYWNDPQTINMAGGGMNAIGIVTHRGVGEKNSPKKYDKSEQVFYLCSAAMIIRREILNKIGLFDESYYYAYEDLDLCWRVNLAGFKVIYFPNTEAYHEENTTIRKMPSAKITFLGNRNRILTLLKNYEIKTILINLPFAIAHFAYLIMFRENKKEVLKAYALVLKNYKTIKKKREEIARIRVIRDKELARLT